MNLRLVFSSIKEETTTDGVCDVSALSSRFVEILEGFEKIFCSVSSLKDRFKLKVALARYLPGEIFLHDDTLVPYPDKVEDLNLYDVSGNDEFWLIVSWAYSYGQEHSAHNC